MGPFQIPPNVGDDLGQFRLEFFAIVKKMFYFFEIRQEEIGADYVEMIHFRRTAATFGLDIQPQLRQRWPDRQGPPHANCAAGSIRGFFRSS